MKTTKPLPYYGGKSALLNEILPLIPEEYTNFIEPFCGGGTVFFSLPKSKKKGYILNDKDEKLVNFYRVCKLQREELYREVQSLPLSEKVQKDSRKRLVENVGSDLEKARDYFYLLCTSVFGDINGGIKREVKAFNSCPRRWKKRKDELIPEMSRALDFAMLECHEAERAFKIWDNESSFFYVDPPYPGADQKYKHRFNDEDFEGLIKTLERLKGRFLLSCYEKNLPLERVKENGWHSKVVVKTLSVLRNAGEKKQKRELLVWNYKKEKLLFDFFEGRE